MVCPKCKSQSVQRAYEDVAFVMWLVGTRRVLCNGCGHVFSAFDPLARTKRAPTEEARHTSRRAPRFRAHLPTAISLIEGDGIETERNGERISARVSYSEPSRGHCEVLGQFGMGLSLLGTKFPEQKLTRKDTLLFIRIELPNGPIESVVSIRNHIRIGEERKRRWFLGVEIYQMSLVDRDRLAAYLAQRGATSQYVVWE
jgi:hypothetical protein